MLNTPMGNNNNHSEVLSPYDHIAFVRMDEFHLQSDGRVSSTNKLAGKLQRAVNKLAEDLYARDTHFILELIQNAEDNAYAVDAVPHLHFRLLQDDLFNVAGAEGSLVTINNEVGFTAANVDAIRDIGESTKAKSDGYLGEKGIGFKSVFRVSSQPHLFSAGYQFRFNEKPEPQELGLGYIVPHWVHGVPPILEPYKDQTIIGLPLKSAEYDKVRIALEDLVPETILFLRKLSELRLDLPESAITVARRAKGRHETELLIDNAIVGQYWLQSRTCEVPPCAVNDLRENITHRTVSVALPLGDTSSNYSVFAYLPTDERSDLPFIVNADFLLSTNRETIHVDRPWNEWLRDEIAPTFIESFSAIVKGNKHKYHAYGLIPLVDEEQHTFFQPVTTQIHSLLENEQVVWTTDKRLVKPNQARFASEAFRKLLASGKIPAQLQQTPLVHARLEEYSDQLEQIGVRHLSDGEILACLYDKTWLEGRTPAWYVSLYRFLASRKRIKQQHLLSAPLLLLEDGSLATPGQGRVYLKGGRVLSLEVIPDPELVSVGFLNAKVASQLEGDAVLVKWVKDHLGVEEFSISHLVKDAIVALSQMKSIDAAKLIAWTRFVRDRWASIDGEARKIVRKLMPLLLESGAYELAGNIPEGKMVVPANLDLDAGWQWVFPDKEDRSGWFVLSNTYCKNATEDDRDGWLKFFKAMSATNAPMPRTSRTEMTWNGQEPATPSPTRHAYRTWFDSSMYTGREHHITDVRAPLWLRDSRSRNETPQQLGRRCKALLKWLNNIENIGVLADATLDYYYYTTRYEQFHSEFKVCLENTAWLSTSRGFVKPAQAFVNDASIRSLLGSSVPYISVEVSDKFVKFLNLKTSLSASDLIAWLREASTQPPTKALLESVKRILGHLSRLPAGQFTEQHRLQFKEHALILAESPTLRWIKVDAALWPAQQEAVFGDIYAYLEPTYPDLKQFFTSKLGVRERVDSESYANAMVRLVESGSRLAVDVETALEMIYRELLKVAKVNPKPPWWDPYVSSARIWTQRRNFQEAYAVFVPDDEELRRRFADTTVEFVWRPPNSTFADYKDLFDAMGIRWLSEHVDVTLQQAEGAPASAPYLTPERKRAIYAYLRNRKDSHLEQLKADGRLQLFLATQEFTMPRLQVKWEMTEYPWAKVEDDTLAVFWSVDDSSLFCATEVPLDQYALDIPKEIARKLATSRLYSEFEDFIGRVLSFGPTGIDALLRQRNLDLTKSDIAWLEAHVGQRRDSVPSMEEQASSHENSNEVIEPEASIDIVAPTIDDEIDIKVGAQDEDTDKVPTATKTPADSTGEDAQSTGDRSSRSAVAHDRNATPPSRKEGESYSSERRAASASRDTGSRNAPRETPQVRGRRLSYKVPSERASGETGEGKKADTGQTEHNRKVESAGIAFVLDWERGQGRVATDMNEKYLNHEGYDLESWAKSDDAGTLAQSHDLADRHIEVKSTDMHWDGYGVGLTPAEYNAASIRRDKYFLYIVERALSPNERRLWIIQDPVGKIDEHVFDHGWKTHALEAIELPEYAEVQEYDY